MRSLGLQAAVQVRIWVTGNKFFPWGAQGGIGKERWELKIWDWKKEKEIFSIGIRGETIQDTSSVYGWQITQFWNKTFQLLNPTSVHQGVKHRNKQSIKKCTFQLQDNHVQTPLTYRYLLWFYLSLGCSPFLPSRPLKHIHTYTHTFTVIFFAYYGQPINLFFMLIIFKCERQLYLELQYCKVGRDLGYHLNQTPHFTNNGPEAQKSLVICPGSNLNNLMKDPRWEVRALYFRGAFSRPHCFAHSRRR